MLGSLLKSAIRTTAVEQKKYVESSDCEKISVSKTIPRQRTECLVYQMLSVVDFNFVATIYHLNDF